MLWATGCSHTYGDDLADKTQAWPYLLANMLNLECVNNAVSGGSNERIVYQTVKSLPCKIKVIAWTYIERTTRYDPDNNFEVNFNPHLRHKLYKNNNDFIKYGKLHYSKWYNDLYAFKLWLQQIILLQKFLGNEPYVMVNATGNRFKNYNSSWDTFNQNVKEFICFDSMNDEQLYREHCEIQHYVDLIDTRCYYNIDNFYITQLDNTYPTGPTGHLLEQAQQEIATKLYPLCSKLIHSQ